MNAGFIFSLCAGILIGLKVIQKKENADEERERRKAENMKRYRRIIRELWYGTGWPTGKDI